MDLYDIKNIKQLVSDGYSGDIKKILMSDDQFRVFEWVSKNNEVYTSELASDFGISIQNASSKLSVLWEKGYLRREVVPALSGGTEYLWGVKF